MKKSLFLLISLLFLSGIHTALAQLNVSKIDQSAIPPTRDGIIYSLPRTVVKIDVRIDKIENYRGPYADFALRLLGLKNVVAANSIDYEINDITISTYAEPDPDQYYFVSAGEKPAKGALDGMITLSNAGVILGTIPEALEGIQNQEFPANQATSQADMPKDDLFGELFRYSADVSVFEKVDTIIRKINIDTMTVERQYYKRTVVEKSPEQKAKEAADFISKIKESRFNLISGLQEVNYNKESLEYMDAQLKTLEKEYLKLFTGISLHKTMTFSYKYIPVPNQINSEIPIFKFLKSKGIVDLDEAGGKIVTVKVQRVGNTNTVAQYLNKAAKSDKLQGFTYRIPEVAKVSVRYNEDIHETNCLINQLGVIATLPASSWKVLYHEATGGIKGLEY